MFFRAIRLPRFKPLLREAPRGHCFGTQKSAARAVAQLIRCAAFAGSPVPYSRFRFCAPHPSSSAGLGSRAPCFWHTCPQLHQSGDIITRRIRVRSSSAGVRCGTPMEHNAAAVLPHSGRSLQAWGFIGASRVGSGASFLYTAGVRMNVVTSGTIGNPHDRSSGNGVTVPNKLRVDWCSRAEHLCCDCCYACVCSSGYLSARELLMCIVEAVLLLTSARLAVHMCVIIV